jgi:hypothetical protein
LEERQSIPFCSDCSPQTYRGGNIGVSHAPPKGGALLYFAILLTAPQRFINQFTHRWQRCAHSISHLAQGLSGICFLGLGPGLFGKSDIILPLSTPPLLLLG